MYVPFSRAQQKERKPSIGGASSEPQELPGGEIAVPSSTALKTFSSRLFRVLDQMPEQEPITPEAVRPGTDTDVAIARVGKHIEHTLDYFGHRVHDLLGSARESSSIAPPDRNLSSEATRPGSEVNEALARVGKDIEEYLYSVTESSRSMAREEASTLLHQASKRLDQASKSLLPQTAPFDSTEAAQALRDVDRVPEATFQSTQGTKSAVDDAKRINEPVEEWKAGVTDAVRRGQRSLDAAALDASRKAEGLAADIDRRSKETAQRGQDWAKEPKELANDFKEGTLDRARRTEEAIASGAKKSLLKGEYLATDAKEKAKRAEGVMVSGAQSASEKSEQIATDVKDKAKRVEEKIVSGAKSAVHSTEELASDVKDKAKRAEEAVVAGAKTAVRKTEELAHTVKEGTKEKAAAVYHKGEELAGEAKAEVQRAVNKSEELAHDLKEGTKEKTQQVFHKGEEIAGEAKAGVQRGVGKAEELAQSAKKGAEDKVSQVYHKGEELAGEAKAGAQRALHKTEEKASEVKEGLKQATMSGSEDARRGWEAGARAAVRRGSEAANEPWQQAQEEGRRLSAPSLGQRAEEAVTWTKDAKESLTGAAHEFYKSKKEGVSATQHEKEARHLTGPERTEQLKLAEAAREDQSAHESNAEQHIANLRPRPVGAPLTTPPQPANARRQGYFSRFFSWLYGKSDD